MVFYKLYLCRKEDSERLIPAWEFLGEMFIKELNKWVLLSYKCPTRLTDIFEENPGLLIRDWIKGKSGAEYYGYRFKEGVTATDIQDPKLLKFYQLIKSKKEECAHDFGITESGTFCKNCGIKIEIPQ